MSDNVDVMLPRSEAGPFRKLAVRLGMALTLITIVAVTTYLGRDGYQDEDGGAVSIIDAFYYSTVSITTTGYGDVIPVTPGTRLATIFIITPARILFLILLVGTTLEILAERSRQLIAQARWRRTLRDHVIVCGYGTKGRAAVDTLIGNGVDPARIVVIDREKDAIDAANRAGLAGIVGDAATTEMLRAADIDEARQVVVAPHRDDNAVLMTLTARELNPDALIVAAAREQENVHLLRQSGADSVITTSSAAGRLLGLASDAPALVTVLEDLLEVGTGLDLQQHDIDEPRALADFSPAAPVIAVVRDGKVLRFDDPAAAQLERGDRVVCLCDNETTTSRAPD